MRAPCAALAAALLLVGAASGAEFEVEVHALKIIEPASLAGTFDAALGDFGLPQYGGVLTGALVLPPGGASDGCEALPSLPPAKGGLATVVLLERGGCFFVEKCMHAQNAGAEAVLVCDNTDESLITMAHPADREDMEALTDQITIPAALITKRLCDDVKEQLSKGANVVASLDWSETIDHETDSVEVALWGTPDQACGSVCDKLARLRAGLKPTATALEKDGKTHFAPHFVLWECADAGTDSADESCAADCIHRGRYCAPRTEAEGYSGKDVVEESLRQLCLHDELRELGEPWRWWQYAVAFAERCQMAEANFTADCSADVMRSVLELEPAVVKRVAACVGDVAADESNAILEREVGLQSDSAGSGIGAVVLLPTLVINRSQYRGRLSAGAALKAVCAGFAEQTEPELCLSATLQRDDCSSSSEEEHGCWTSDDGKFTACVDTFRGHQCKCPQGFTGDGTTCEDVDECAEGGAANCEQTCANEAGSFRCGCGEGYRLVGVRDCLKVDLCEGGNGGCEQVCVPRLNNVTCLCHEGFALQSDGVSCAALPRAVTREEVRRDAREHGGVRGWQVFLSLAAAAAVAAAAGLALYRWRVRSEIRDILQDYIPLDSDATELHPERYPEFVVEERSGGGR